MNKKIATSYPKILSDFLTKNNVTAEIEEISGSVEIAPGIGLADAICDIVSSGSTLLTNGLKEVETLLKSQAVIISNRNLNTEKQEILKNLLFRIRAVKNAKENKYILLNAPESAVQKICDILPGMKSPTIVPLVEKGWCSLHSVVQEDQFWERINQLKEAGAEGILVIPIEKMIL
jgi:ATP phosphoribosyltransferase